MKTNPNIKLNKKKTLLAKQLLVAAHLYLLGMYPSEKNFIVFFENVSTDSTQGVLSTETSQLLLGGPTF